MNLPHRPIVLPTLLAAAALALTGCGGDSTAKDDQTDLPLGPISQRMADMEFDKDAAAATYDAFQEAVAACMKEQGFDFIPEVISDDFYKQIDDMPEWGSEEFAKTYGYGASTWQDLPGAGITTYTDEIPDDAAYWEALTGSSFDDDEADEADGEAWASGGCYAVASAETGANAEETSTLARDIEELATQADEDASVVAALGEWSSCMADQGYDYQTSEEAERSFRDRALTDDGDPITGDALKALNEEEIATAVADYQCGADVRRVRATVLARLETDYYAEHKTEVDAYLAQLEEAYARN